MQYKQPRRESGLCYFSFARYSQKCVTQSYRALYGSAMLGPIRMGTNMAADNQQEHLSLRFNTKAYIYLSRNSKTIQYYFFQCKNCSDSQIPRFKSRNKSLFNQLGRHVNTAHAKSYRFKRSLSHNQEPIRNKNLYEY